MKMFCISDNPELEVGLKLSGCEGIIINDENLVLKKINEIINSKSYGVLVISKKLYEQQKDKIDEIRLNVKLPLITII